LDKSDKRINRKLFKKEWLELSQFKNWLKEIPNNNLKCKCIACNTILSCGKSELVKHCNGAKHIANAKGIKGIKPISMNSSMSVTSSQKNELDNVKKAEIKLSCFYAIYALIKLRQLCETNRINKLTIFKNEVNYTNDKLNWSQVRAMYRYIFKGTHVNVLIYSETTMSKQDKIDVIKLYHDSLLGGHLGVSKTLKRIRTQIQWKGMRKDVRQYIEKCESCQKNKSSKKIKLPMAITTTSTKPFQKIFLDIVGKLPTSYRNNSYILTIQDDLTKFLLTIPLEDHKANTMAKAFVTNFVCIHGIPMNILTDNGPEFVGEIFTEVCKILKINKTMASAYRPETNGSLERAHRVIKEMLRHTIDQHAQNWCEHIPFVTFAYNSAVHESTNF